MYIYVYRYIYIYIIIITCIFAAIPVSRNVRLCHLQHSCFQVFPLLPIFCYAPQFDQILHAVAAFADVLEVYPTFSCSSLPEVVTHWGFKPYVDRLCKSGLLQ